MVVRVTIAWFLLAVGLGASGLLRAARPPLPQAILIGLAATLLVLYWTPTSFRDWALAVDLRILVAVHVTRLVGIYFLVLYARGELPYAFAVSGGWGDIAVAVAAVAVCLCAEPTSPRGRSILLAWNALGLSDIVFVVLTAACLAVATPESMRALLRLPLSLLPTFLVPIIIATHVIIFSRLTRRPRR